MQSERLHIKQRAKQKKEKENGGKMYEKRNFWQYCLADVW